MSPLLTAIYTKLYNDIVELRNTFKLPVNTGPLSAADLDHHEKIFRSEFRELALAGNRLNTLDGIVDSVVTLMGRCVHEGMRPVSMFITKQPGVAFLITELVTMAQDLNMNFEGGWDEIHRSNLSKVCPDEATLKKTQTHYKKIGVETYAQETLGGWVVKVKVETMGKDGNDYPKDKFLKSVTYSKPDLTPFV